MDRQRPHSFEPVLRRLQLWAAVLLGAACSTAAVPPEHAGRVSAERVALPGSPAANYVTQSSPQTPAIDDASGVLAQAFDSAMRARGVQLEGDARLTALSRFIADHLARDGTLPSQAAIDLAARHLGLVEPTPHFVVVGTDVGVGI